MKRLAVLVATLGMLAVLGPNPAGALSCIPPEPVGWESRFPRLEAALVMQVTSVKEVAGDETFAQQLRVAGDVIEVLKGSVGSTLEYTVPSFDPWGPYYQAGDRVAVVIEDGVVSDGRQQICGPWYEPEELRRAAELYGDGEVEQPPKVDDPPPNPADPQPAPAPEPQPRPNLFEWLIWVIMRLFGLGFFAG